MKYLLTVLAIIVSATSFGQTAGDYLKSGIEKHKSKDYTEAIKDYTNAINVDKNLRDGYYNRGVCELILQDFKAAKKDLDKTIELDPKFVDAYYSRASVFVIQQKYIEALPDLDKTIELEPTTPNALTLRGQIRAQTGNQNGACEDFNRAKKNGDAAAEEYITKFCGNGQHSVESLILDWPDSENWKVGDDQENAQQHVIDLVHSNETVDNWTELGNMTSFKGVTSKIPMDKAMNLIFDQAKQNAPKAKLTFIEKEENVDYPWIIFTVEASGFKNGKGPESQLWYIIQGKQALYTNFRAIKKAVIPDDLRIKWTSFFKTGKIVSK